jgi:hypothetical protein
MGFPWDVFGLMSMDGYFVENALKEHYIKWKKNKKWYILLQLEIA